MKTQPLLCLLATLFLAHTSDAATTTIDFDDVDASRTNVLFLPTDHYKPSGAVFSRPIPVANVCHLEPPFCQFFTNAGGTASNAVPLTTVVHTNPCIDMSFVIPGTMTRSTTDFVRARFLDGNVGTSIGMVQAFDINGMLIASTNAITPSSYGLWLEVRAPSIARVRFCDTGDGCYIDNVSFSTPTNATLPVLTIRVSEVELCWNSLSNKMYQIEYRSALTTNTWTGLGASVLGNGSTNCVTDRVPLGQPQRFYRVQELP